MARITLNPKTLFNSTQYGFSQIAMSNPGKMVFISGSVGGTMEHIMMLRIYKVDYQPKDGAIISSILKQNFGTKNPPASTWISVKGLANEGFMIEIEAQAVI